MHIQVANSQKVKIFYYVYYSKVKYSHLVLVRSSKEVVVQIYYLFHKSHQNYSNEQR